MPDLSGLREGDEIAISSGVGTFYDIRKVAKVYKLYVVDDLGCKWSMDGCARPYGGWGENASPATDWHRGQMAVRECRVFLARLADDKRLSDPDLARRVMAALMEVVCEETKDAS